MRTNNYIDQIKDYLLRKSPAVGSTFLMASLVGIFVFLGLFGFIFAARDQQLAVEAQIQEVVFINETGVEYSIRAEVADEPLEREQGLMFRNSMPEDAGMLFVFETERRVSFWMKNTFIPLDIIYFDQDLRVVKIYENTTPNQTNELYDSEYLIKYALETNAGWVERSGIQVGDFVRLP